MPRARLSLVLMSTALWLTACDGDDLTRDVAMAYAPCSEEEIRALTSKHAIQTVFSACGSNNFDYFAWSPGGIDIYFQLPFTTSVMSAEDKKIRVVPVQNAIGRAVWLSGEFIVVPTRTAEGKQQIELYNRSQGTLQTLPLSVSNPKDLQPTGGTDAVIFTALDANNRRLPYRANFTTSTVERAFPWIDAALGAAELSNFDYSPALDLVSFSDGAQTTIASGADGAVWLRIADASRAVVHPEGRYVAIETLGAPISPFDQTTWEALGPEERAKREAESKAWLERQRGWVPKGVRPPVIEV